jgi:lipase chaperone LimK
LELGLVGTTWQWRLAEVARAGEAAQTKLAQTEADRANIYSQQLKDELRVSHGVAAGG